MHACFLCAFNERLRLRVTSTRAAVGDGGQHSRGQEVGVPRVHIPEERAAQGGRGKGSPEARRSGPCTHQVSFNTRFFSFVYPLSVETIC